jgi:hypothetical protein
MRSGQWLTWNDQAWSEITYRLQVWILWNGSFEGEFSTQLSSSPVSIPFSALANLSNDYQQAMLYSSEWLDDYDLERELLGRNLRHYPSICIERPNKTAKK